MDHNEKSSLIKKVSTSITIEEVSDNKEKLNAANKIVAKGYAELSSIPLTIDEIMEDLSNYKKDKIKVLLSSGLNPNTNKQEPLSTIRAILGSKFNNPNNPPLKIMNLFSCKKGWENFAFEDFDPEKSAELTKLSVEPNIRQGIAKEIGLIDMLGKKIISEIIRLCFKHGKNQIWAILQSRHINRLKAAGLKLLQAPGVELNYKKHKNLFEKEDKYWIKGEPGIYRIYLPEHSG